LGVSVCCRAFLCTGSRGSIIEHCTVHFLFYSVIAVPFLLRILQFTHTVFNLRTSYGFLCTVPPWCPDGVITNQKIDVQYTSDLLKVSACPRVELWTFREHFAAEKREKVVVASFVVRTRFVLTVCWPASERTSTKKQSAVSRTLTRTLTGQRH